MPILENQFISVLEQPVSIKADDVFLQGDLVVPEDAFGLVLFAAADGMSRASSRSRRVVRALEEQGLATLLFDLLTPEEDWEILRGKRPCPDISLKTRRLVEAAAWAREQRELHRLPFGFFGACTAAAAALAASTEKRGNVEAIVSRSGCVDLVGSALGQVRPPTLLLVAAGDAPMVRMNESALLRLGAARKELILIPGVSPRFDDQGELEIAADLAADWFARYLILLS